MRLWDQLGFFTASVGQHNLDWCQVSMAGATERATTLGASSSVREQSGAPGRFTIQRLEVGTAVDLEPQLGVDHFMMKWTQHHGVLQRSDKVPILPVPAFASLAPDRLQNRLAVNVADLGSLFFTTNSTSMPGSVESLLLNHRREWARHVSC